MAGLFREPKKLGEKVRIKSTGEIGYKQACRISDNKVLVFIYVTKRTGNLKEFDWNECERV